MVLEGAALTGLLKTGLELAGKLFDWTRGRVQSSAWRKRLLEANRQLLLRTADTAAAKDLIKLAEQAGYSGPELSEVKRRVKRIVESGVDSNGHRKKIPKRKAKRTAAKRHVKSRAGTRSKRSRVPRRASSRFNAPE